MNKTALNIAQISSDNNSTLKNVTKVVFANWDKTDTVTLTVNNAKIVLPKAVLDADFNVIPFELTFDNVLPFDLKYEIQFPNKIGSVFITYYQLQNC